MSRKVDRRLIREAVRHERVISIKTTNYLAEQRSYIDRVLEIFLEEARLTEYTNKIAYCVHELAGNAWKGNVKRAYFRERELDIHDHREYEAGMQEFRGEMLANVMRYTELQQELGIYLRVDFQLSGDEARISIRQNIPLTEGERRRIEEKLSIAAEHSTMVTAYENAEDTAEGAGLGLIMTILMLRNIGLTEDVLEAAFTDSTTTVMLRLSRDAEEDLQTA